VYVRARGWGCGSLTEKSCSLRKHHLTPWAKSIGARTNAIRFWDVRTQRNGERHPNDGLLNYYLERSDVDAKTFDKPLTRTECIHQANNARVKFKDTIKNVKKNSNQYEHEVAVARVERRHPHLADGNCALSLEREEIIFKDIKRREDKRVITRSFKKMGRQIRGHVKPSSLKKTSLTRLEVQDKTGIWKQIQGKESIEEHIAKRNMEQFSHAGKTPFGYTPLGAELGHTGDTQMAEDILDGTLEHEALRDNALQAIVKQLRQQPAIQQIIEPIITVDDLKSAFKCVPENTASSYSGRGYHHYKECAEGSSDGLTHAQTEVHAALVSIPLLTGYCPERCKHIIDGMLKSIPGVVRSNKLRIIQLLEAHLNQVLQISCARNITRLAKSHEGMISRHQYGRSHNTCISPVLNKLLTIQLLIQNKTNVIIFDNDAKGCYDRIVIGISLATLRRLGYSKESVRMLGHLWAQMQHHVCTGFGVSEATYGSTIEKLLYGIGQGSCASPILWALLNQLILATLEEKYDCIRLVAIDGVEGHVRPGDSFVDDTTCGVTYDDITAEPVSSTDLELVEREEALIEKMEDIMQYFLDFLQVTGGDLAPENVHGSSLYFGGKMEKQKWYRPSKGTKSLT
jgi:hypothetical protein